jgi:Ca-activated chloride channel family protein
VFRLANPLYLLLLAPLAVAAWHVYRRRRRQGLVFSALSRIPATGRSSWRIAMSNTAPAFFLAGTALAIVALARPQTVFTTLKRSSDAIAIMMTADISGSMQALDFSDIVGNRIVKERTRLDVVKETFAKFVDKRTDDLVGLVTFGGYASTRSPLTMDHKALLQIIKAIEIPAAASADDKELLTAIGDGLATACARIEKSDLKSRIIVLLSDGESNTGIVQPADAARLAKQMGIKVYTIGIGSNATAPVRGRDMFGRERIVSMEVHIDEETLKAIARETGGLYFNVRNTQGLEDAMKQIDSLEKTRVEREIYEQYDEWFPWLLAPGLALILLGTTLNMAIARRLL